MNRVKTSVLMILAAALCLFAFQDEAMGAASSADGFEKTAENDSLVLYVHMQDGRFAVEHKPSGFRWWSNPPESDEDPLAKGIFKMQLKSQLIVTYANAKGETSTVNNFVSSMNEKGAQVERTAKGFKAVYRFPKQNFVIPIEYTLESDHLKAEIVTEQIRENDPDSQIIQIALLPYFGAGSTRDSGYMFVPDGPGALIRFNNGKTGYDAYKQKIYGNDDILNQTRSILVTQKASLPVFGIKSGDHAFVAVVGKGDSLATVRATVSGSGTSYNQVFSEFAYRQLDKTQLLSRTWAEKEVNLLAQSATKLDRIEVNYYVLNSDNSDYSGMALRYQQYLMEEKGLVRSAVAGKTPFYLDIYGAAAKKKSVFGIPYTAMEPLTSFGQSEDMVGRLFGLGVDNIVIRYKGWANDGLTNLKIPSKIVPVNNLGGTTALNHLLAYVNKRNIELYPDIDLVHFQKSGNGFSSYFDPANAVTKLAAPQYSFVRSTYQMDSRQAAPYLLTPLKMGEAARSLLQSYAPYRLPNISLNTLGEHVYSDYRKSGIDRGTSVGIWSNVLADFRDQSMRIMMDNPNGYALPYASHVTEIPVSSSRFDIEDESVPFYQIVLHGIVPYSVPSVNRSSDPDLMKLKAIETGSYLHYSWMDADNARVKETDYDDLYSTHYRDWIDSAAAGYKELQSILYKVADRRIVNHRKLGSGVFETTYENQIRIIVNYNEYDVDIEGRTIGGTGYLLLDGAGGEA